MNYELVPSLFPLTADSMCPGSLGGPRSLTDRPERSRATSCFIRRAELKECVGEKRRTRGGGGRHNRMGDSAR